MNNKTIKPLSFAVTAALAATMGTTAVHADNPFAASSLSAGYMTTAALTLGGQADKEAEGKCGEGKCGGEKTEAEGKCGEGKCGGEKTEAEGKCGEGKCGGSV